MWIGFFLILVAGVMNGSFATPMKHVRGWAWEHTWLLWSVTGLLLVPMAAFFATVAHAWEVYRVTDGRSLWMVVLFGLLWGISAILFGVGVARVGVAVGFALILGISSVLGSMIPLLSKRPEALLEPVGQLTAAGVLLQVVGVGLCGLASHKRARDGNAVLSKRRFWTGLLICFLSGLGAPMVNFGLVFGTKVSEAAVALGTPPAHALNAIWPLLFGGALLVNCGYCVYLIQRGSNWKAFARPPVPRNFILGGTMGVLWMGSNLVYAYGSVLVGPLGLALGWPVMMGCVVLTANAWGAATGEWRGTGPSARRWMAAGTAALVAGVCLIGAALLPAAA